MLCSRRSEIAPRSRRDRAAGISAPPRRHLGVTSVQLRSRFVTDLRYAEHSAEPRARKALDMSSASTCHEVSSACHEIASTCHEVSRPLHVGAARPAPTSLLTRAICRRCARRSASSSRCARRRSSRSTGPPRSRCLSLRRRTIGPRASASSLLCDLPSAMRSQESARLLSAYQESVARMQSELVDSLAELGRATRRRARDDVDQLMRTGLPAIETILARPAPGPQDPHAPPPAPLLAPPAPRLVPGCHGAAEVARGGPGLAAGDSSGHVWRDIERLVGKPF